MTKPLVIVESPAKARTISKFLGDQYMVEASIGHIRDLPRNAGEIPASKKKEPWARLGVNVEKDFAPLYIIPAEKQAQVKKLKAALAQASVLYLATDEDREGESISWHLLEVLKPKVPVHRLVFHEITKPAIEKALREARQLHTNLVEAQETRRIMDRLYGYAVSPLLWRKIRPQLSAGRVQSVAVRLIVGRERERLAFHSAGWWDITGMFSHTQGELQANLVRIGDDRPASSRDFNDLGQLQSTDGVRVLAETDAKALAERLTGKTAEVVEVTEKPYQDKPAPPFITSTLQQEAIRKLRWSARRTMSVAQRLYENGWITYMRTDSVTLSEEALAAARALILEQYGAEYLPDTPNTYTNKSKNAQEAHEAIRPSGTAFRSIDEARVELVEDEVKLYELIWMRTVACQMTNARGKRASVRLKCDETLFQANGKTIDFPGFRRAYVEGSDDPDAALADRERLLPPLKVGETLAATEMDARGHATKPPARLTEASLVKELEAKGIGRPSTYASIIDTILRRNYVFKKGSALVPTFTAFAVTNLMEQHLGWLVDYEFTANMEAQLDEIASGDLSRGEYLSRFYLGETGLQDQLIIAQETVDPRQVCTIPLGQHEGEQIDIRVGRYGPYINASETRADVPDDLPPDELTLEHAIQLLLERREGPKVLGTDPETGKNVYMMKGRFGPYIQLGEVEEIVIPPKTKRSKPKIQKTKPPRSSLLRGMAPEEVGIDVALQLLTLPRTLGEQEVTDKEGNTSVEPITAANGRFGPYVKCGKESRSIPGEYSVLDISKEQALVLLAQPSKQRRGNTVLREIGTDETTERDIKLMDGRFGPYVTDGKTNASVPRDTPNDDVTIKMALALIRVRENAPKKPKRTTKKKPAAKKKPAVKK
ncbi:MAG: DNA topoisomerase-1, partial [Myxococcota bacterium]